MGSLLSELKEHEGFRPRPYRCSAGFLTIGYGLNLDSGITETLAAKILEWQVTDVEIGLSKLLPFWLDLTRPRQEVFVNMAFNLGIAKLLEFRRMLECAKRGNVDGVCREMEDSKWAVQVGGRAKYLIEKYRVG